MSQRAWFWNLLAGGYFRQAIDDPAAYETKLEMTRKLLRPDMRLEEFGCGTGGTRLGVMPILRTFTSDQLIQEIEAAGFRITETFQPAPDKAIFLIAQKL